MENCEKNIKTEKNILPYIWEEEGLNNFIQDSRNMYGYIIKGRRALFSEATARDFGVDISIIDDLPLWEVQNGIVAPESAETWYAMFDAIDSGEKSGSAEVTLISRGEAGRYRLSFKGIADGEGTPVAALISYEDITLKYQQEQLHTMDINALLHATQKVFSEIVTINLTQNSYRILKYHGKTTRNTAAEGVFDEMIDIRVPAVLEEDREAFVNAFSREKMLKAFSHPENEKIHLVYRRLTPEGLPVWFETIALKQDNPFNDDVLGIAVSYIIDEQKAEEARLREELRMRAEEIRLTMSQMGKKLSYYDIPNSTLTVPALYAKLRNLPEVIPNFPESLQTLNSDTYMASTINTLKDFYSAIRRGIPSGSCDAVFITKGVIRWERLEFATIFSEDGVPLKAIIAVEDVTDEHARAEENAQLRENERLLRLITQHTDRSLCYYDIEKATARPWDKENCAKCTMPHFCKNSLETILESEEVLPESKDDLRNMFKDIHRGVAKGGTKIQVKNEDGERRWFDIKYSTIYNEDHKPLTALISHQDITDYYEREVAYQRWLVSMENDRKTQLLFIESDITADLVEHMDGEMISFGDHDNECTHTYFVNEIADRIFFEENRREIKQMYSCSNLLVRYIGGQRRLENVWKVHFSSGEDKWINLKADLMTDPYSEHIKAFIRVRDVTNEYEELLSVKKKSEIDGMTGLLNRATCEEKVRGLLGSKPEKYGTLLLMDLDNLKYINDSLGHEQGDRAIKAVAATLKKHFRESDIIGRVGGDEYLVFLKGSADNVSAISITVAALLRKLAGISIGAQNEHRIHCSVGCAVQMSEEDDFDTLYKQADLALYHVKRNGKNNFAFFTPEMREADYQFRKQKIFSLQSAEKKLEWGELQYLLRAISSFYSLMLSANLSADNYYLMETASEIFAKTPTFGTVEELHTFILDIVHPDDRQMVAEDLSREGLLKAYTEGKNNIRRYVRLKDNISKITPAVEIIIIFYTDEQGDVCEFTLVRNIKETEELPS